MRRAHWIALSAALSALPLRADDGLRARGEALFTGRAPLQARLAGHSQALPPQAAACIRCHGADRPAPALSAGWLRKLQSRRNGPPANYDTTSMCRTLRSGIDPVQVSLPVAMPRFEVSDTDCAALWAYLDSPDEPPP